MSDMDAQTAIAVLNRASEVGMYAADRIPESDADKITAAEQSLQLCRQYEEIIRRAFPGETDDAVIAQKAPDWPGVARVLAEVEGLGVSSEPAASVDPSSAVVEAPQSAMPAFTLETPEASPEPDREEPTATPQVVEDQGDPKNGETWLDHQDVEWLVVSYSGGTSARVKNVASGESTIVPAGFLKRRQTVVTQDDETKVVDQPSIEEAVETPAVSPIETFVETSTSSPSAMEARYAVDSVELQPQEHAKRPIVTAAQMSQHSESTDDQVLAEQDKYDDCVERVQDRYRPAGMPVPTELDDPPEIKAEEFAEIDDLLAKSLHAKFNALAAYAKYRHDVEDAISRECDLVRLYHMRRAMAKARVEFGKDATVTEVKIVAEADPLVAEWAAYAREHAEEARAIKTFHDIYAQHVVVLSRDWSMREAQVR